MTIMTISSFFCEKKPSNKLILKFSAENQ